MRIRENVYRMALRFSNREPLAKYPHLSKFRRLLVEQMEDRRMFAVIDLATLSAAQGSAIFGASVDDNSGFSVSSAGDVNGDGFDDIVIGAVYADASGNAKPNAGESYVIFGGPSISATIDLANLGTAGITIFGADADDQSGSSVSKVGDVNGDGFDDLMIGARFAGASANAKPFAGESYLIFGGAALPATIDLASLGTAGVTIFGADTDDFSSKSFSNAGDVNGDGFDDLLIGAYGAGALGNAKVQAGESYLIFGAASMPATIDLANLGTAGVTIFGSQATDQSGFSVSSAGDVNGDGLDDLLIGAPDDVATASGDSYLIFGSASLPTTIDLASLGIAGVRFIGVDVSDRSGTSLSRAGDVNGDGFDDLLIGAPFAGALGNAKSVAGDSYVIFGGASLPTTINLATLGTAGVTIFGADADDQSGRSVSAAGDVNGDGFDDLLIGAYFAGASGNAKALAGESYVIFGGTSLPTTVDLGTLGAAGITIFGAEADDQSGWSVSGAGDVNGDGFDDVLIGARFADASGNARSQSGDSYLIFGSDFTAAITHPGTAVGETLTGNAAANVMIGGRGNDTLIGNGGADVLTGGQGNDVLAVSDLTFRRLVGGTGSDTLRLDGSGLALNLTTLRDNRLLGIEQIDITGSGNNTLSLNQREVLNLSDESNTLVVRRNAGDVVNILDLANWTQAANETIGPDTFNVYNQGAARLKVAAPVTAATVVTRGLRYFNATGSSASTSLATDKVALLPGQTSTFANYTNYSRGLNGIVVDINGLPSGTSNAQMLASLQFAQWDGIALAGFAALPGAAVPSASIAAGAGAGGSSRVTITFPDNTVQNTWLRVTVLANGDTGLSSNDVFYFGNVRGDFDVGNTAGAGGRIRVSVQDTVAVRNNQSTVANSASVTNIFDVNRDGAVTVQDTIFVRNNQQTTGLVAHIAAPSARAGGSGSAGGSVPLFSGMGKNDSGFSNPTFLPVPEQLSSRTGDMGLLAAVNSTENKRTEIGATSVGDNEQSKLESTDKVFSNFWDLLK